MPEVERRIDGWQRGFWCGTAWVGGFDERSFLASVEGRLWRRGRKKGFKVGEVEGNNDGVRNGCTCILFEGVQDKRVHGPEKQQG